MMYTNKLINPSFSFSWKAIGIYADFGTLAVKLGEPCNLYYFRIMR